MVHPFEAVPREWRGRLFVPLLVATALILALWVVTVAPMSNERAPLSVSSFGTAWTVERARGMMESWDERARLSGAFGIGFDFLQLVVYSITFALACAWVAQSLRAAGWNMLATAGALVAWGQFAAVLCGTVQNAVMMALLLGSSPEGWLKVSYFCTILKLLLLFLGPAFALLGSVVSTRSGRRASA